MKFSTTIYSLSILSVALAADCPNAPNCSSAFQTLAENFAELNRYLSAVVENPKCYRQEQFATCIKEMASQYSSKFIPAADFISGEVAAGRENDTQVMSAVVKAANIKNRCPIDASTSISWLMSHVSSAQCSMLFWNFLETIRQSPKLQEMIDSLDNCDSVSVTCSLSDTILTNLDKIVIQQQFLDSNPACLTSSVRQGGDIFSCMGILQLQFLTRVAPIMKDEIARLNDPVNPITNPLEEIGVLMYMDLASSCPFTEVISDSTWMQDPMTLQGCLGKFTNLVEFIKSDPNLINAVNTSF